MFLRWAAVLAGVFVLSIAHAAEEKFIVHEWGVMIRASVLETPGPLGSHRLEKEAQPGTPRVMLAAPNELLNQLPPFVLRHAKEFTPRAQHRAWDKPVLHFYGPEGLDVTVRLLTPHGRPLAYWPKPKLLEETFWRMGSGVTDAVGMEWTGKLSKAPATQLETPATGHWWQTARAIPGLYFNSADDSERFIFYEATAFQEPLLTGKVTEAELELKNAATTGSGPVLVIVNDGAIRGWVSIQDVPAAGSVKLSKAECFKATDEAGLLATCRAQWVAFGMTKEEAHAIVEIWKPDLLDTKGFLAISRLPNSQYEKIFPLEITPKPAELVRAGLIFDTLPGEAARINWLPELGKQMAAWSSALGSEDFDTRAKAARDFAKLGDLATPELRKLADSPDVETSTTAKNLLTALKPQPLEALPAHGKGSRSTLIEKHER